MSAERPHQLYNSSFHHQQINPYQDDHQIGTSLLNQSKGSKSLRNGNNCEDKTRQMYSNVMSMPTPGSCERVSARSKTSFMKYRNSIVGGGTATQQQQAPQSEKKQNATNLSLLIIDEDQPVVENSDETLKIKYARLMTKLQNKLGIIKFGKLRSYLMSQTFTKKVNEEAYWKTKEIDQSISNVIRDICGVELNQEEVQLIVQYAVISQQCGSVNRNPKIKEARNIQKRIAAASLDRHQNIASPKGSIYSSVGGSAFKDQNNRSIIASSDSTSYASKTSTVFSRPFTCLSFVSSTTAGTTLTKKIDRMNKATIKLLAKQFINCRHQLEQSLAQQKLEMKTKLTIPELQYFIQQTDLAVCSLSQLQNLLIAVLYIQQPSRVDLLLSFNSLLYACQFYIDQSDIESKDSFNRTRLDKIIDEIRDFILSKKLTSLSHLYAKYTECESLENYDKVLMTNAHFLKFVKHALGDKYSSREIEQVYRTIVSQKPMTFKRFQKTFTYDKEIEDKWEEKGHKILSDYILKKKMSAENVFKKLTQENKITKQQWRDIVKREGLPFNLPQCDFIFEKLDKDQDKAISLSDWCSTFKAEAQTIIGNSTKEVLNMIQEHFALNKESFSLFKKKLEQQDSNMNGFISLETMLQILNQQQFRNVSTSELERFLREQGSQGRGVNYQKLLIKLENTKSNYPLKEIALRLAVFLQQNHMSAKVLLQKLVETKKASFTNKQRGKTDSEHISVNYFSKFIKAKVDKKRSLEEIKELVILIDLDRDGIIGLNDLESFIQRSSYHEYFEKLSSVASTKGALINKGNTNEKVQKVESCFKRRTIPVSSALQQQIQLLEQPQVYPKYDGKQGSTELLPNIVRSIREAMQSKNLRFPEAFALLDPDNIGMVSFQAFCSNINKITDLSQSAKELLFTKLDRLNIGMFQYDQFVNIINRTDVSLRLLESENSKKIKENFTWEQNIINKISCWIQDSNLTLTEAFKIIDSDFDGIITLRDLKKFLAVAPFNIDPESYGMKIQRVFKILDISKTGKILLIDFEKLFNEMNASQQPIGIGSKQVSGINIDWQESCRLQIQRFICENYSSVEEAFQSITNSEDKLKLEEFLSFLEKKFILKGLSLTRDLLYTLFASFDSHRKGFLTRQDWIKAFKKQTDIKETVSDIKLAIGQAYNSKQEAFRQIAKGDKLNKELFSKAVEQLLPQRYSQEVVSQAWLTLFGEAKETVNLQEFKEALSDVFFRVQSNFRQQASKHMKRSISQLDQQGPDLQLCEATQDFLLELHPRKTNFLQISLIIDKLRKILKARGLQLKDLFDGGRMITSLVEFKNKIKPFGLHPREIDKMYEALWASGSECTGMVDLNILQKKIDRIEQDQALIEERNQERIKVIKELMIKHMNTVEDAFHLFDSNHKGKLSYDDFLNLLEHLYRQCASREPPTHIVSRDIFDQIDIKQDGLIDKYEWAQTFSIEKVISRELEFIEGKQMPDERAKQLHGYPQSWTVNKNYLDLLQQVGRNIRVLRQNYHTLDEKQVEHVPYELGVAVYLKFVRETLILMPDQYSDYYLEDMVRPFAEIIYGQQVLKHKLFTDTLKKRHFIQKQVTKNRHASVPREIIIQP